MKPNQRACQNCKVVFEIDEADRNFYEKMEVPAPTFCWLCRAQRRLAFRGERRIYKRKSDFSGEEIFSMYAPEMPVRVYEKDVWLSDRWDPMEYGKSVDFTRPFLSQLKELLSVVPLKNLNIVGNAINSEYTNHITEPKNSYLVFNASNPEDCYYSNGINFSRDCIDVSHVSKSELCYESFWLTQCATTVFSSQCESCLNTWFSKDCTGCNNCFGCVGLRNKSYYIFNEPYRKEDYERKIKEFDLSSYAHLELMKKRAKEFWRRFPDKYIVGSHNTDVSGNYIERSKNVKNSFLVREGENLRYCQYVQELPSSKDCYDYSIWGDNNELVYECCACGIGTHRIKFCLFVQENVHNIEYSIACSSSFNLFGCVGLRKKQYCILNKQYTKDEYEALVPKIIQHMTAVPYRDKKGRVYAYGEFFPIEFSPFFYNDTVAQEYFSLSKERALEEGFNWKEPDTRNYQITIHAEELPDRLADISDTITKDIVGCADHGKCAHQCTTAFRILQEEIAFYRRLGLPIPRLCPGCRHGERIQERTSLNVWHRNCTCRKQKHFHAISQCPNVFETCYDPQKRKDVWCEQCYREEFVA